jgi:hypothetical protein
MANVGYQEGAILQKIASIDWQKEINRENILKVSNANKLRFLEEIENRKKEKERQLQERIELEKKCHAAYFLELMKENCEQDYWKPLEIDDDNSHLIKVICSFLSRDKNLEEELNLDANKGLMVRGISGLGKTFLFELVKDNLLNPVKIISMINVAEAIKEDGFYHIERKNERIIYLDDVGTEEASINYYGTKVNWFKDFIEKYYTVKNSFKNLVISTNLSAAEMEEKYGSRVRSRMREMFNVIDVIGKDRRR